MVSDSEPRSNWSWKLATVGIVCLCVVALLLWSLYPEKPNLTGNSGYQEEETGYYPGGSDCYPSNIMRLPRGERAERAITCDDAKEQHRLNTNDLIQQRRSADAADAMTILAYKQAWVAAWGLVFGFLTLCAAIAAAAYARSAAVAAKDAVTHAESAANAGHSSAGAGWKAAGIAQEIGMMQIRAHLAIDDITVAAPVIRPGGGHMCKVNLNLRNTGSTQTKGLTYSASVSYVRPQVIRRGGHSASSDLGPGDAKNYNTGAIISYFDEASENNFMVYLLIEISFKDVFSNKITDLFYYRGAFHQTVGWPVRMHTVNDPFEVISE